MYRIFTYIWAIFGRNVGKYSIHGAFGYLRNRVVHPRYIPGPRGLPHIRDECSRAQPPKNGRVDVVLLMAVRGEGLDVIFAGEDTRYTFRSQSKWGFLDPGSFWNMMLNMSDNVGAPILRCGLISPI